MKSNKMLLGVLWIFIGCDGNGARLEELESPDLGFTRDLSVSTDLSVAQKFFTHDSSPKTDLSIREPSPDLMSPIDSSIVCTASLCATATVIYPNGAAAVTDATTCFGTHYGVVTSDNRVGAPSGFERLTCDDLCALATSANHPMRCSAACSEMRTPRGAVYSFGGGALGGFAEYSSTATGLTSLSLGCSEMPAEDITSGTATAMYQHQGCCCESVP